MKTTKVLLTENVDDLGIVGDVVRVKPGYARNYLIPHQLATSPTDHNVAKLTQRRAEVERELREQRVAQEATFTELEDYEITLQRSANEQGILYGGVSTHEIAQALRDAGVQIDDKAVRLGEQIKRLDSYEVPIVLASDLKTHVKVWVVSDKPAEELQASEDAPPDQPEGQAPPQPVAAPDAAGE